MPDEMKPAYLLAGTDESKLTPLSRACAPAPSARAAPARSRISPALRAPMPDADALIGAIPAISLTASRRYLLADGVERWKAAQVKADRRRAGSGPPDVTVVLVARGAAPKGLAEAVGKAGGDVLAYEAPKPRDLPSWLMAAARERGFSLDPQAARVLVSRLGEGTVRLSTELDRLAIWAGEGGTVDVEDVEMLTADNSERAGWTLGDAIVARDVEAAVASADAPDRAGRGGDAARSTAWPRAFAAPTRRR